jgi:hypothetical protein
MTIVWTGCVVALCESLENAGVNGSHFGGGFFVVRDGGKNGRCIATVKRCPSSDAMAQTWRPSG